MNAPLYIVVDEPGEPFTLAGFLAVNNDAPPDPDDVAHLARMPVGAERTPRHLRRVL